RRRIRDGISNHGCGLPDDASAWVFVSLTPLGVAAWERAFEPDWDRYVDVRVRPREAGRFHLRARRRDVLERVVPNLVHAGVVVDWATVTWNPPRPIGGAGSRWSTGVLRRRPPEEMHGVSFRADKARGSRH